MRKIKLRIWLVFLPIMISMMTICTGSLLAATDITDKVQINKSRMLFDRRTSENFFDASLTNISEDILLAPIRVVISSISVDTVFVANPDGYTDNGEPYFEHTTANELLDETETTNVKNWRFANPERARFNFTTLVEQGTVGDMRPVSTEETATDPETGMKYAIGQIILTPTKDTSLSEVNQLIETMGGNVIGYFKYINLYQVLFQNSYLSELEALIVQLNQNDIIHAAILNTAVQINENPNDLWRDDYIKIEWTRPSWWYEMLYDSNVPSGNNAAVESMNFPNTWEVAYPDWELPETEVKIGIIDTDFPVWKVADSSDDWHSWHNDLHFDWVNQDGNTDDYGNAHGHLVAGIIGAIPNNQTGITGTVWGANLYGYRLGKDHPYRSEIFQGIKTLIIEQDVEIINLSFGGEQVAIFKTKSLSERQAYLQGIIKTNEAFFDSIINLKKDFLLIQAAGNESGDAIVNGTATSVVNQNIRQHLLVVGAYSTSYGEEVFSPWSYSNYGPTVDIFAPGGTFPESTYPFLPKGVYATEYDYSNFTAGYNYGSGTSYAAPHITGLAGLIKQKFPNLSCPQIREAIISSATKKETLKNKELINIADGTIYHGEADFKVADAFAAYNAAHNISRYIDNYESIGAKPLIDGFMSYYSFDEHGNKLSWLSPKEGITYKIYWGTDDSVSDVNYAGILETPSTEYTHTGVLPGYHYYYKICYVEDGVESALSDYVYSFVPSEHTAVSTTSFNELEIKTVYSIASGGYHTVGLKADGTVVAVGFNYYGNYGNLDVGTWTDIVAVAAGHSHTVGLKADGTVVAGGYDFDGELDVGTWTDIVAVAAGDRHTVGLKADGTVVAVGQQNSYGDPYGNLDVGTWTDIVAVAAGHRYTVGLKVDGTVVAEGYNYYGELDVGTWTDIVAVAAGGSHTVGLKADGTVVAVGYSYSDALDVDTWTNIVAVAVGNGCTIGLKADGTVVAAGRNDYGELDIGTWTDIVAVAARNYHTVGLKADGRVVAAGRNDYGELDVQNWSNIMTP